MRGKEPDIPYLPWALERTMAQVPPTGPDAKFEATTDPQIHYCEPPGPAHIYMYPAKAKFVQTPEAVYILHEVGPVFRAVWLNAKHPKSRNRITGAIRLAGTRTAIRSSSTPSA